MVTYSSEGNTAKFIVEFGPPKASDSASDKDFAFEFGKGKFVAVDGSDASVLLRDLKKELEAKTLPGKVKRVESVRFEFVFLGEHYSQAPGGGLNQRPVGY